MSLDLKSLKKKHRNRFRTNSQSSMTGQTQQQRKHPFFIGISGGTCCGKSEVCNKICQQLDQNLVNTENRRVTILAHKSFYRELTSEEKQLAKVGKFNFDHPTAFDDELALRCLEQLKGGNVVKIPTYNVSTHSREPQDQTIYPSDVILFEGILSLYNKDIRDYLDMKIFVDTDSDTRLARRVLRDTLEHKRNIDSVLDQYTTFVKRSFEDFTLPTKKYADVIIPRGGDNTVAINLIVEHIQDLLGGKPNTRKRTTSESSGGRPH